MEEDTVVSLPGAEGVAVASLSGAPAGSGVREEPMAAWTQPLEHQRQSIFPWISGTCLPCKELRVRCCGGFPCTRCFVASRHCRPGSFRPCAASDGKRSATFYKTPPSVDLFDFAIYKMERAAVGDLVIRAVRRLQADDNLDLNRSLSFLRAWCNFTAAVGADVTQGAAQAIQAALGFTDDDVLVYVTAKPSPLTSHLELQQAMTTSLAGMSACGHFQTTDDGSTAVHVCVLGPGSIVRHAVNAVFAESFQNAQALLEKAIHYHLAPCLLMAPMVACEERQLWVDAVVASLLAKRALGNSVIVKVFDRMGQMRIRIFQARQIESDGWPGALFKWEDFSPSRHLVDAPKRSHRVVNAFRAVSAGMSAESEEIAAVESSEGLSLPRGLIGLPLPLLGGGMVEELCRQVPVWPPAGSKATASASPPAPSPDSGFWGSVASDQSPTWWLPAEMFGSIFQGDDAERQEGAGGSPQE